MSGGAHCHATALTARAAIFFGVFVAAAIALPPAPPKLLRPLALAEAEAWASAIFAARSCALLFVRGAIDGGELTMLGRGRALNALGGGVDGSGFELVAAGFGECPFELTFRP